MLKQKKNYSAPRLKRHGSVEQLTHDLLKKTGRNDFYSQQTLAPLKPSQCC